MQTLRDWEALAKLHIGSAWSAEWLCVVDAPRPLASFKPADVIVIPLRNSEPHEFWRPSGQTPGRRPAPGPPALLKRLRRLPLRLWRATTSWRRRPTPTRVRRRARGGKARRLHRLCIRPPFTGECALRTRRHGRPENRTRPCAMLRHIREHTSGSTDLRTRLCHHCELAPTSYFRAPAMEGASSATKRLGPPSPWIARSAVSPMSDMPNPRQRATKPLSLESEWFRSALCRSFLGRSSDLSG